MFRTTAAGLRARTLRRRAGRPAGSPLTRASPWLALLLAGVLPALAQSPPGTEIENRGLVDYTVDGIAFAVWSNTDRIVVQAIPGADTAELSLVAAPSVTFPGDTIRLEVAIRNTGTTDLPESRLTLTLPDGATLRLPPGWAGPLRAEEQTIVVPPLPVGMTVGLDPEMTVSTEQPTGAEVVLGVYDANGNPFSATADLVVAPRSSSSIGALRHAPGSGAPLVALPQTGYFDGVGFVPLSPPPLPGGAGQTVLDGPIELAPSDRFRRGETFFVHLEDADQNKDPQAIDAVLVDAAVRRDGAVVDRQTYRLLEIAPDAGEFFGYLTTQPDAPQPDDGRLAVAAGVEVDLSYRDAQDGLDVSVAVLLVDPFGRLFDTATGAPVDGVQLTLVDAATGLPATVYGDDGSTPYPATVVSGAAVTDGGGATYPVPPGGFRFPLAPPGAYRLLPTLPAGSGYGWPSTVATEALQSLPGAPFAIEVGSRGEAFVVVAGPPMQVDVPLDPTTVPLWVSKQASKGVVSTGDFLQYRVEVENTRTLGPIGGVELQDRLPVAFRYRPGSTRVDGVLAPDPAVSADGRVLTFGLGDLAPATRVGLTYVVAVGPTPPGPVANRAYAAGGGISSNVAEATVVVREDLLLSRAVLVGRVSVIDPASGPSGADPGVPGVRVFLEDGTYVVTDEDGKFHFEGIRPGVHVVQLDLDTLPGDYEPVTSAPNTRFAGRAWSQFVDLPGGTLWRTDFEVARRPVETASVETGAVEVTLASELRADIATQDLSVRITGGATALHDVRLTVVLPPGSRYRPESARLDAEAVGDPERIGDALTFRLGERPAASSTELRFEAEVDPVSNDGRLVTKASLAFASEDGTVTRVPTTEAVLLPGRVVTRSEPLEHSARVHFDSLSATVGESGRRELARLARSLADLDDLRLEVTGHADSRLIRSRSRQVFPDNDALSAERARAVARYLEEELGVAPVSIVVEGRGAAEPLAANDTPEGRAQNRRVEVRALAHRVSTVLEATPDGRRADEATARLTGVAAASPVAAPVAAIAADRGTDRFDASWIETLDPGTAWIHPAEDERPSIPSVHVGVQHAPADTPTLYLGGTPVPPLHFERRITNRAGTVAFSLWRGIDLAAGDNDFEVVLTDASGATRGRLQRRIHYPGPPVRVEWVEAESALVADGMTPPVIAVRLLDADGYPTREGSLGDLHVDPPYRVRSEDRFDHEVMPGAPPAIARYAVERDGLARIALEPTTLVDDVRLVFPLANGRHELVVPLRPAARDWILVGLATGTLGHNAIEGHLEPLSGDAAEERLYADGRLAFYAKGRIKAAWLLTVAYDSERETGRGGALHGTIDPGTYYTVYGDDTTQGYDAASREKLYLKIERDVFQALFGDFDTGFTVSELARYDRSLTGVKSRYRDGGIDVTVFAAETEQAYVKDELRGQGVTGPYRLSRGDVVLNSEKVTIEARDRFRSETILASRALSRHLDYDVDYTGGTLVFREAVPSTDERLNPVFVVVDYETHDPSHESATYGARARFEVGPHGRVGLSHVREGDLDASLYGIDLEYDVTPETRARAEYARTAGPATDGDAWFAEVRHTSDRIAAGAYYRELGEGFGLGQHNRSERGTRKAGAEGSYRVDDRVQLRGQVYRQADLEHGATREVAEAETVVQIPSGNVRGGLRAARDDPGAGARRESNLLTAGLTRDLGGGRWSLRVDREHPIGGDDSSVDFPARTLLGLDHHLNPDVTLFVEQEWARGARDTRNSILGVRTAPWTGAEVSTALRRRDVDGAGRSSAAVALRQRWSLGPRWSIDTAIENVETLAGAPVPPLDPDVPFASGADEDFVAASAGATFQAGPWMWTARADYRDADSEVRRGLATSIQTDPRSDLGVLLGVRLLDAERPTGEARSSTDVRLGLAWRRPGSRWAVLDRLDWIRERTAGGALDLDERRIVNNLNVSWRPRPPWQLGLLYGAKYVRETIDGTGYDGYTDMTGLEARYDFTPRWDVGVRGSVLHAWDGGLYDYSLGASVGHQVVENAWISLGYNVFGFADRDFSAAEATSRGPFVRFRFKFDQSSVREMLRRGE